MTVPRKPPRNKQLKIALLDSVTHELRTPLTSIKASVTALLTNSEMSLPQRNELLIVINEEADRLNKLVGEAMKVTQYSGPVKLNLTSQAIEAIIDAARTDCRRLLGQRSLFVRLPAGLPLVRADSNLAKKALVQFAENAIKYSPPSEPILITAELGGRYVTTSVVDQGTGIQRFRDLRRENYMANTNSASHVRVIEETPAYWRVVFDYPPFNIVDASIFEALQDLLARMNDSPNLRVVVFESANPEFYLSHFDLTGKLGNIMTAVGASGFPILMDTFVRLTKSPVVSIAKIRGCVRGVSSEFVLACDMRFASRENTRLGQPEVGVGLHPGGGGTERLPQLVGRGRALEIILGANDFDGDTAERYGYFNRALPDAELGGFVDALARRIASFDRRAIAAAKNLVNHVSLPSADRLLAAITSFETALTWPETQQRIQNLLQRGLQRDSDFETRWPEVLGTLLET